MLLQDQLVRRLSAFSLNALSDLDRRFTYDAHSLRHRVLARSQQLLEKRRRQGQRYLNGEDNMEKLCSAAENDGADASS